MATCVSLADIKQHLNIDNELDDVYLNDLIETAEDAVQIYLNRKLTDTECCDSKGHVRPAIKHAVRLLVGGWYASREPFSFATVNEMPFAVTHLLTPLKKF